MQGDQQIFAVEIGAEERRIVGIDHNIKPGIEHAMDCVVGRGQVAEGGCESCRGGADGKENAAFAASFYQRRLVDHMVAMIDAIAAKQIKRIADIA